MNARVVHPDACFRAAGAGATADIDGDSKLNIVGGGRWFKHLGGTRFQENLIDPTCTFSRAAAGQLKRQSARSGAGGSRRRCQTATETLTGSACHEAKMADLDGNGTLDIWLR